MWRDLRFALRCYARRPGFAVLAVLTLALGIGTTSAVFSIVSAVLLRPLPYKDPGRLVAVWVTSTREKRLARLFDIHGDYDNYRLHAQSFESVSTATWATRTGRILTGYGPARNVLTIPASATFFDALGVPAMLGRTFRADDEARGCAVVLSHDFWASALGTDRSIAGKSLTLDRAPCTVLGVMPERFVFYPSVTQAWVLMGPDFQADLAHMPVGVFARLKRGVSIAQAQAELNGLFRSERKDAQSRDFAPVVDDLHGGFTFLAGRTLRSTLLVVFAAVLLLLLIACLNVANLLMARLSERHRELAVRAALGAPQRRLVRQVLVESLVLGLAGAALGVGIAAGCVRYFHAASPIELTAGADVAINLPVLLFTASVALAATLVFGLAPALRSSRVDLAQRLKRTIGGRQTAARVVVAVEMAMSFLLLIGAGLLMASAFRMQNAPLGFDPSGAVAMQIALPVPQYSADAARLRLYDRILEELPGAALASRVPPDVGGSQPLEIAGRPPAAYEIHDVGADVVSPSFFDVLRVPVRRGRVFDARDREGGAPVAVVNEALAREYFPQGDPLGQQIRISGGKMPWLTIVGVVGNLKHTELMNEMDWVETPILYQPLAQDPRGGVTLTARGIGAAEIRRAIAAADGEIPIANIESFGQKLARPLAYPRFRAAVLSFFALAALLLAAVGLHGVLSQLVAQRVPEFGVRRAVGAQAGDLIWLVARQGGVPVLGGLAVGIGAALAFSRVLARLLYGIQPADPPTMIGVSVVLLAVAAVAMVLPARRAARVDPMKALREE